MTQPVQRRPYNSQMASIKAHGNVTDDQSLWGLQFAYLSKLGSLGRSAIFPWLLVSLLHSSFDPVCRSSWSQVQSRSGSGWRTLSGRFVLEWTAIILDGTASWLFDRI